MGESGAYTKKNSKLEAFLKKNTDVHFYESIRASDACIVISEKDSKAFKFVLLNNEGIYLLDNPPKPPKKLESNLGGWLLPTVSLRDIVRIELKADFPEFLSGAERDNAQHVVITYKLPKPEKPDKKGQDPKSSTLPLLQRSILTNASATARSDSALLRGVQTDPALRGGGFHSARHVQFRSTEDLKKLNTVAEESQADGQSGGAGQGSGGAESGESLRLSLDKLEDKNGLMTHADVPPLELSNGLDTNRSVISVQSEAPPSSARSDKPAKDNGSADAANSSRTPRSSRIKQFFRLQKNPDPPDDDLGYLSDFDDKSGDKPTQATLHLYIMDAFSPFLGLAKGAWYNYIIQETLNSDDSFAKHRLLSPRKNSPGLSEKLEILFNQLKTELLRPGNDMEDLFYLVRELKNAAQRQFFIKKLFWKSSDLYPFLVRQVLMYLPNSPSETQHSLEPSNDTYRAQRADELEYIALLCETLAVMLRETEIFSARLHALAKDKGKLLGQLLTAVTHLPRAPGVESEELLGKQVMGLWKRQAVEFLLADNMDDELEKLIEDVHQAAVSILFEVFLITKESIFDTDSATITIDWMFRIVDDHTDEMVDALVLRMALTILKVFSPFSYDPLTPTKTIQVYHQLSVLKEFFAHHPKALEVVRTQFTEEFRFYLQPLVVHGKLCREYPVYPYIIKLLRHVVHKVTSKHFELPHQ